ncbi:MAG: hypothetical protein WCC74_03255 [Minisyncoccia bacterium]
MSINDLKEKIKWQKKYFVDRTKNYINIDKIPEVLFVLIIFILASTLAFSLGRLSTYEKKKTPISVIKTEEYYKWNGIATSSTNSAQVGIKSASNSIILEKGNIVASKSGTKYYFPWCSGVTRIKEENKVWFNSVEEARAKGLTPASGCEGLK